MLTHIHLVINEDDMARDFVCLPFHFLEIAGVNYLKMGFLRNLVKVFPSLANRPLHITGESYAGMYIVRL